jgi:hypothetical protein
MDSRMLSHRWEARSPDWTAAAVAGFAAGALLMVLELLWAMMDGGNPWTVSYMIAAIVAGPGALNAADFNLPLVALALGIHYVLGIVFGMILGAIIAAFHFDSSPGMALAAGAAFGVALYLLNFFGMAQIFPWFSAMRGWTTLVAHLVFGMAAAIIYWKLERHVSAR